MSVIDYSNQVVNSIIQTSKIITNKLTYEQAIENIDWIRKHLNELEKELTLRENTREQQFDNDILD